MLKVKKFPKKRTRPPVQPSLLQTQPSILRQKVQVVIALITLVALGAIAVSLLALILTSQPQNILLGLVSAIGLGITVLAVGFFFAQATIRQATESLENLRAIAYQFAQAYFPEHELDVSGDDVATLASLLQEFVDKIESLTAFSQTKTVAPDPQLQADVEQIVQIFNQVADGDLVIEAKSSSFVIDSIKQAIARIADTLQGLSQRSQALLKDMDQLQALSQELSTQAQQQQASLKETQAKIQRIVQLVQSTQEQEQIASQTTQLAKLAVQEGEQGIVSLRDSINSLQQGTALIVQRIRSLDEFVTLAKQFVLDQKRLASLTQVLAMNASMVAARALEQREPDQFASVAREFAAIASQVNNLATQTNQGLVVLQQRTGFVEVVVSGIAKDVQDVSSLVNQFTNSVDQSRQSFDYLKQVSDQVAQVEQAVLAVNGAIEQALNESLDSAQLLASATQSIIQQAQMTHSQSLELRQQLDQMSQTITRFRLPQRGN
jgi:methyl-accepting chemotaxis protein PixJ